MKIPKLLSLLLVITLLKGLIWAYIIPPFQSADEGNHFAYVQFVGETNQKPDAQKRMRASLELIKATEILNFDWNGNHPMWSKEIFNNVESKDNEIRSISFQDRKNFVFHEGNFKNPFLYYFLGSVPYKISSFGSIFESLYAVRTMSVVFAIFSVLFSYKIAYLITKNQNISITTAALVSFQPSFTNITSTVTNDSMAIFSVTLAIYLILKQSFFKGFIGGFLALLTRVHLGILLLYPFLLLLYNKVKKKIFLIIPLLALLIFLLPIDLPYLPLRIDRFIESLAVFRNIINDPHVFNNLLNFLRISIPHYLNEVFPWYFGVFGWLEITLPPIIYTVFKILVSLSLLGFLLKRKNPYPKIIPGVISALLLFLVIFIFDFITFVQNGTGAGVQGRHLIPAISIHFLLLLIGLELIIPLKWHTLERKSLVIFMVIINFVGIYKVVDYFYGFNSQMFERISFFKPSFINLSVFSFLFIIYIVLVLNLVLSVTKLKEDEKDF